MLVLWEIILERAPLELCAAAYPICLGRPLPENLCPLSKTTPPSMMCRKKALSILFAGALLFSPAVALSQVALSQSNPQRSSSEDVNRLLSLFSQGQPEVVEKNIDYLDDNWKDAYAAPLIEVLNYSRTPHVTSQVLALLKDKTGVDKGRNPQAWYQWLWNQEEHKLDNYGDFKAAVYGQIDPKFSRYFHGRTDQTTIRLDEVRWGGVKQDGIPPLRDPKMIPADQADYLDGDNVVFGIDVNGDVRAYPKRILAWHELFVDEVGGMPVAGVYCTLCGTVILYETELDGTNYDLGTSGFLYRSNKLMYDEKTQSLWNTLKGKPVVGPLVEENIELEYMSVVTTTWEEWQRRHPDTKVLSLDTGYQRDYSEGEAYKKYFATDELMFNVPFDDKRLKNKDEILALKIPGVPDEQLAIAVDFLENNTLYTDKIGDKEFVVFTDRSGGNRVYLTDGTRFEKYDGKKTATDRRGTRWTLRENKLVSENGEVLERLPTFRAFWFGWHAAYPGTRLVM